MRKYLFLSVLMIMIGVGGYAYYNKQSNVERAPIDTVLVKTVKAQEIALPKVASAIGTITAKSVDITPEIAGHVKKVGFIEGKPVKAGDLLIRLDDSVYRAKYDSAVAKLKLSELNHDRIAKLSKKHMVSRQALDQSEADLKEHQADAAEAAAVLKKTKLLAPFDGIAGKSSVGRGDFVNGGQKIVTVTDIKNLKVEYNLPEKTLSQLKAGQQITFTTSSFPEKVFHGEVAFISPTIERDSRTLSLYANVRNDNRLLAAGMFVNVAHSLGSDERVVVVPERALIPVLEGQQVYKVVDGKAYAVKTVVGRRMSGKVQILTGLSVGDLVITDGQQKVKNGMPVKT